MADNLFIPRYLETYTEEVKPKDFYRRLFPDGELENHGDVGRTGKYNAIAVELIQTDEGTKAKRYVVTNELDILDRLLESNNFIILSPISYAGKSRKSENARYIYALAIDLDGVSEEHYLRDLFFQIENEFLPKPTFIVWSGAGLHLYYQFERPVPCYKNVTKQLSILKDALTRKVWNGYVTELHEKPQVQSLFQGFRLVGGVTKGGDRTRAFETGDKVTIEYLNEFVYPEQRVKDFAYKSKLTKAEAEAKYPDWYQRRVIDKHPKGTWTCKPDLYHWWLNRLKNEIRTGHRYYGVMCLAVYAKKAGIPREQLESDAFGLVEQLDKLTEDESNHFTNEDVLAAIEMYNDSYFTFPIDTISKLTDLRIEKNKRNYRKQNLHLKLARSNKAILKEFGEMKEEGRPSKMDIVKKWMKAHPDGTVTQCSKDLGISRTTVYKYWND